MSKSNMKAYACCLRFYSQKRKILYLIIALSGFVVLMHAIQIKKIAKKYYSLEKKVERRWYPGVHELSQAEPFLGRVVRVRQKCEERRKREYKLRTNRFKYHDNIKLLMCETPKVASTTWQLLLLRLSGFQKEFTKALLHQWDYSLIPNKMFSQLPSEEEAQWRANNYTSFLVTRQPFERLVSAYTSKLTNRTGVSFYRNTVGKEIARGQAQKYMHGINYQKTDKPREAVMQDPKFKELNPEEQKEVLDYVRVLETGEVSFPQFIEFVIAKYKRGGSDALDPHWRPQVEVCKPCAFNYSYIIRFENIAAESNRLLGYMQDKTDKPERDKISFPGDKKPATVDWKTQEMFKKISEKDVETLRKIYEEDFSFYGYDPFLYSGI